MKAQDRARLTTALRDHVAKIAADMRAKMRAPGASRVAAEQLHKDERVAEDFEVWTDLLSRRAAVLWVLKSVYVRVLEDRGLLAPGRLLDPEAQQLFEKLAPNLGETAFLRWIYKDLSSSHGGVPELFSPQPAEVALPSDELSRALIAFWRHRDADSSAVWSFAEEHFEGELMGDLYQELDPVVKDRFALCQTPDFVRAFILDRTLTPAIETFGADEVRLVDPACGSGHFLIDGLKRLVVATATTHADWDRAKVVAHALDRVVGVDLNDYACALARTRLIMTAAELAGVTKLADAARFHPHVYWADGLEQVEKEEQKPSLQFSLFETVEEKPRATLTRSDVRAALKKVFEKKFHAVVANPPYIVEADKARAAYHKEKIGGRPRYVSAYQQYSLGSPFIERSFGLACAGGFVGLITSNNFTKRTFGKPLIEKVLPGLDLDLIVDTSQTIIPHHDTPTVLLFGRNRGPSGEQVRVVMSTKGEEGTPDDPAQGKSWVSILSGWQQPGFNNDYISVVDVPRATLNKHPWSLGGGGAAELKSWFDSQGTTTLGTLVASIGRVAHTGADSAYVADRVVLRRHGIPEENIADFVEGDRLRDWALFTPTQAAFPYDNDLQQVRDAYDVPVIKWLWRYRSLLWERREPQGTHREIGFTWHQFSRFHPERFHGTGIAFAAIASDNHFVLTHGDKVFKQSAPVIRLKEPSGDAYFALLGILNSSISSFWIKQVFYPKGSRTKDFDKGGTLPENNRYDLSSTGMMAFPLPAGWQDTRVVGLARAIDALARERLAVAPENAIAGSEYMKSAADLRAGVRAAGERDESLQRRMIALQEELDWRVYHLYGITTDVVDDAVPDGVGVDDDSRPFCATSFDTLPPGFAKRYAGRREAISKDARLKILETPVFKRLWRGTQGVFGRYDRTYDERARTALDQWFALEIERALRERGRPSTAEQVAALMQGEGRALAVAEYLSGRPDFDLGRLVREVMVRDAIPSSPTHRLTSVGLIKLDAWERTWEAQRREDAGEKVPAELPPLYASSDFVAPEYWATRGKYDVPREPFIAFTEVPGRSGVETLYGWAGWTAQQRAKAILAIDEELEDASVPLADRIGLLDSAWRLLPDVAREDAAAANRLKAELQALVGPEGPSNALIEDWKKRFPPPSARAGGARKAAAMEVEEDESLDDLPSVIPSVSDEEHVAILIWALLHASGGSATRMDLARAFALRARPALLKKLAPSSLKGEVAHWVSTVGARSVKAGLLASTLKALAARSGVALGTDSEGRATVSTSPHSAPEAQIDPWFLFEANLALKVLRAQSEEKFSEIDKALKGADSKLLEAAA